MSIKVLRRNLAAALSLLLLICPALACEAPVSASEPVQIGMNLHSHPDDVPILKRKFDIMADMHVKWVRIDIDWSVVEAKPGKMNWTLVDEIVDEASAHGIAALGLISYTPAWALGSTVGYPTRSHYRPSNMFDYANFVRSAVQRYAPRGVQTWEIWNEPNSGAFWPPRPDPDEYGRLFRVAAQAVRGVDPKATVLIGGLSPQYDGPQLDMTPVVFLEQLYRNGAAQLADGVAAHPYSYPSMPLDPNGQSPGGFTDLPKLNALMDSHGDGGKKIWITEFGAPTGNAPNAVSEDKQSAILLQARQQVQRWDWAGPLFYYELMDHGSGPHDREQNFGVINEDFRLKPAALGLMAVSD